MRLSQRLILSYLVIILLSLSCAFITLIVIARPLQNRLNQMRLVAQAQQAEGLLEFASEDTLKNSSEWLERVGRRTRSRLLLINQQGQVVDDSRYQWLGQQLISPLTMEQPLEAYQSGRFTAPDNETYRYVVITSLSQTDDTLVYLIVIAPDLTILSRFVAEASWGFLVAGVVSAIVSLIVGIFIARSIARPLQQIALATREVSAGNYAHRLETSGPQEIQDVAENFNQMTTQVQASQQAMRDFVSNVSHELKTPLTSIQGFSQAIIEEATPNPESQKRAAQIIYDEATRMSRLVSNLLDLARLDSGQATLQHEQLDVAAILCNTAQRLLPQASKKQINLQQDLSPVPILMGDGDRLAQVFTNLLNNAIQHTTPNGTVKYQLTHQADIVEISITDNGPGIPAEELSRIFERFYQVDKSRQRGSGTGLGLAISKEIIEAHNGTLTAESIEALGSRFVIRLPI